MISSLGMEGEGALPVQLGHYPALPLLADCHPEEPDYWLPSADRCCLRPECARQVFSHASPACSQRPVAFFPPEESSLRECWVRVSPKPFAAIHRRPGDC